ncbi:tetratricopeptide repeat protein [Halomarina pelagica]|uniref:tetratricopeptide repeat protein n=1 Tax=Halomarina pelagica TaxID=2961599 RepID=UPI0020C55863|nr:tetratricopeptide repeat protein [Halomarina sp. BND7]
MDERDADDEFVRLLRRRRAFLERLSGGPRRKRALVEGLDCSRSTVDRALRELELEGLVERTDGGYTASLAGRLAVEEYRDVVETIGAIVDSVDLLRSLPDDCGVRPDVLVGVERAPTDDLTPYELPPMLRECVSSASRLTAVVPVVADPRLLGLFQERVADGSIALDLVVGPDLHETLCRRFPDTLRELADGGASVARGERTPPCTLLVAERRDWTRAAVCVTYDGGARSGVYRTDADAALDWATGYVERVRGAATDVTDAASSLAPGTRRLAASPGDATRGDEREDRRVLEREGFVELTDEYFAARSPAPPTTSWRTGLDLAEVAAGYAVNRTYVRDGERRSLADDLLDDLRAGGDRALVGPPGSGKSTVCKTVAHRWFEAGHGPVLYRKRGTGEAFASVGALRTYLDGTDGHALVVVEDALREEAVAVFGALAEYRDDPSVSLLVDAREREWEDPSALPPDARVADYRSEAVERVRIPGLTATECERFVRHFEATTGRRVDLAVDDLLDGLDGGDDGDPADLLVVLHRLALSVDPLASYGSATPTTLTEDVGRTYDRLRDAGDRALDVGTLVNLLNAADVGVSPDLVHALAADDDHDAVADALDLLDGRVIFGRVDDGGDAPYRSVHESWSALFLRHLTEQEGEHAAERRFGRVVTALLSLADDETRRARIEWEFHGAAPAIRGISADPGEWADATVERVFALGLSRPGLAPLYGSSAYSRIDLPAACSPELAVRCTQWRGEMSLRAGRLDAAEREFEYLASLADGADDAEAAILHARSLKFRGTVALRRSEFDDAESFYERSLAAYRAAGDEQGEADVTNNLGIVAWSRGDLDVAEAYLRDCLERYRAMDDRRAEADAQFNLATILDSLGDLASAVDHYRSCLDHYRAAGDRRTEADTLNNLGNLWRTRGDLDASERSLTQALDTYRDIGDRLGEANCLHNLGHVAQLRGEFDASVEYHERGLDAYRDVGDTQGIAHCLNKLGDVDRRRGDLSSAESRYRRSLEHRRDIGDGIGEAQSLVNLGRVAHRRGDDEAATEYAERGLARYRESGEVRGEAEALRLLGRLARERGAFETARERLRASLARCRDGGHRYGEARTLVELGLLAAARGEHEVARERHEAALAAFTAIGAVPDVVDTHLHLADALAELGDAPEALAQCEEAITLAERNGLDASEAIAEREAIAPCVREEG